MNLWISLPITEEHLDEVRQRLVGHPIYRLSHRQGEANEVGIIGEVIAERYLTAQGLDYTPEYETTHDLRFPNRQTIDVKTKDRTVAPETHFDCSVPLYNHDHQKPTYYMFISIQRNRSNKTQNLNRYHTAHILGTASQHTLQKAKHYKKGQTDTNGTTFWTDCLNLHINQLASPTTTTHYWKQTTQNLPQNNKPLLTSKTNRGEQNP